MFFIDQQHSDTLVGIQEDDSATLESPADLIARGLIHVESAFRLKAFERGQRYLGLVSERLLSPTKQRACGPRLSGGDHA